MRAIFRIKLLSVLAFFLHVSTNAGIVYECFDTGYFPPIYAAEKENDELHDLAQDQKKMLKACLQNDWPVFFDLYQKYEETPQDLRRLCNSFDGPTPLLWATLSNNPTMVRLLLKHADRSNIFNKSVLYWAARLEYKEIVEILLDAGFRPDQTCKHYHKCLSSSTLRAKQLKQIITRLHEHKKRYIASLSPLQEAQIKRDKVIAPLLFNLKHAHITEDDLINEIDCDLSGKTALIITACPFLMAGALYLFELYRLSDVTQFPLAFDITNYQ